MQALTSYAPIAGVGYEGPNSGDVDLKAILTELQGHKISMASATTSGGCAAVTGMTAADTIKTVLKMPATYAAITDVTSHYTAAAGGMTCSVKADSDGAALIVFWVDASGA